MALESLSGMARWRALGLAADLRCPLHQVHPAGLRPGVPIPFRQSQLLPRLPLSPLISARPLSSSQPRCVLAAAALPLAPFASLLATSAATPLASTTATSAAASAATAAAAQAALPPFVAAIVALLPSIGTFLLCLAASVLLLAAVPTVQAMGRAAARAERVLAVAEEQLPDTLAAMRLSGLEVTDCIQELGALGGELTRGVRSTAALASMAEAGVKGGLAAADTAVKGHVVPALARAEKEARGAAESHLQATSQLRHTKPLVAQAASAVTTGVRRLRAGLLVGQLATVAVQAGRSANDVLRQRAQQHLQQQQRAIKEQHAGPDEQALREQLAQLEAQQERLQRMKEQQQRHKQQASAASNGVAPHGASYHGSDGGSDGGGFNGSANGLA